MKKSYIIGALILLILVAGGYFYFKNQTPQPSKKTTVNRTLPREVTVTLDKNGFSPKEVTIKTGSAVRWKNTSGEDQSVNSSDHPTHQKHKELNFGIFSNGSSVVYTFTKTGEFSYHNHLYPEQTGKIIVER